MNLRIDTTWKPAYACAEACTTAKATARGQRRRTAVEESLKSE
jgi:hypothetical protein